MSDPSVAPSFFGLAFLHPLNILMLGGAAVSAALTGSLIPLAVGAAVEVLWLGAGARMGAQRELLDFKQKAARLASGGRGRQAKLSEVTEQDRRRFLALDALRGDIRKLVADSDSLEQDMLQPELAKVDRLVDSFLDLAARCARYETFVASSDLNALESEVRRQEAIVERTKDREDKELAVQNLELMQARLLRAAEVRGLLKRARGQLNLVENTLELMRDQVASLQSPAALSEQLDELVRSVEAIEASAKETRALEAHAKGAFASH